MTIGLLYLYIKLFVYCFPRINLFMGFMKYFKEYKYLYLESILRMKKLFDLKTMSNKGLKQWGAMCGIMKMKSESYGNYRRRIYEEVKKHSR